MRPRLVLPLLLAQLLGCGNQRAALGESAVPGTSVLLDEHFADASLAGWRLVTGASTGDGPRSLVRVESGALQLTADGATRAFLSPTKDVSVRGAKLVRISVKMKTENVSPAGAKFQNCDLYVRFAAGTVIATTPPMTGSRDWAPSSRTLRVPDGAETMTVGAFLSMPGRAWFDDVRIEGIPDPFVPEETEHFRYWHFRGDPVQASVVASNDADWNRAATFFGSAPSARVTYWKYPDLATLTSFTGVEANALNTGGEIHSIWPTEPHELAHLFASAWGDPPSLLAEGVAVYFSGQWQSQPIGEAAGAVVSAGRWIAIRHLLDTHAFRALPSTATYAVAGALAQWVDQTRGHEMLRALYAGLHDNLSAEENARRFATILGIDVDTADRNLRESLAGGLASPRATPR